MRVLLIGLIALALTACGSKPTAEPSVVSGTQCSGPRPQVCTMEYNPVCATLVAGGSKQYASPCNACADDAVAAYQMGACPEVE